MPSQEEESPKEHEEFSAELKWLVHNQAALDARLARVEDSMVFRTLRAIGNFYQTRIARGRAGESRGYATWRANAGMEARPSAPIRDPIAISIFLMIRHPSRAALLRAIDSVRAQTYRNWQLIAVLDGELSGWVREVLGGLQTAKTEHEARTLATGRWMGTLGENDSLSPVALEHFAAAARDGIDLIYSDAEVVDAAGAPLRPLFKPDWSPVLLRSVPYTGGLTLARSNLAGEPARVVHLPRILYHAGGYILPEPERVMIPLRATQLVSIIVCTRTSALIERCLNGIENKTTYPAKEIVIVQHMGSTNASAERAVTNAVERSRAKRVEFGKPFNFAEMNNQGAREAAGELLLFLNDDVGPITPDWLTRLVKHLEDPAVGAVGAMLLYPTGAIQHAGIATWLIDGAGHPGRHLFRSDNWPWLAYTREVTAVTGACLCMRRSDFEKLGGFDPTFPVNYNDVDLCLRLREAGYTVVIDTAAVLRHDESQTRRPGTRYDERRLFFRRWSKVVEKIDPYYSPHLAQNNENLTLR